MPLTLNPEGAYSIGISVGNRRTDIVLIDFVGKIRFHKTLPNPQLAHGSNHSEFLETIASAVKLLPDAERERLAGVGLALPRRLSGGMDEEAYFKALQAEIEEQLGIAVFVQNDITAAASGESMFGAAKTLSDYMFFYLGATCTAALSLITRSTTAIPKSASMSALRHWRGTCRHRARKSTRSGTVQDPGQTTVLW